MDKIRKVFLREANRKIGNGDYQGALEHCENVLDPVAGDCDWIRSRVYFATGELQHAEQSAVDAILKEPANYGYYRTLGEILGAMGEVEAAKSCLQGSRFGDYINQKYFPREQKKLVENNKNNDIKHEDIVVYREPGKPLDDIIRLDGDKPVRPEFRRNELHAATASVQVVDNGKVWFDGHNLCVFDRDDNLINACTMGNPALIEKVRHIIQPRTIEGNLGVVVARSSGNYFHWTTDVLPGFHLIDKIARNHGGISKILVSHQETKFQMGLMDAAGVDLNTVFTSGDTTGCYFRAEKVIVPVFRHKMAMGMSNWAIDFLHSLSHQNNTPVKPERRIYISRRDVGSRGIENEDEVVRLLTRFGFEDVTLDGKSVHEQMQLFQQSEYIVAPHGAGLTNIVYCQKGATVCEFFGDFVQPCFRSLAALCELRYAHLSTGDARSDVNSLEKSLNKHKAQRQDQRVDIDALKKVLIRLGLEESVVGEQAA